MTEALVIALVILVLFAALTRETFVVVLFYLLAGSYLISRWWSTQVISKVQIARKFEKKVFPEETVPVEIDVANRSWLPAVWLRVQDLYPVDVAGVRSFHQVLSLAPHEKFKLHYDLKPHRRGYYTIGPFNISSGDLLGMSPDRYTETAIDHLTVYPRVIPLTNPDLPSRSPMGTLRHHRPIYEDPSRPLGKRDYTSGDSLRRIDWKATASSGRLQVKIFEPSIALETAIFLNLNVEEYHQRTRFDSTELAIVVAASLASWAIAKRQSSGLFTNGDDPLSETGHPPGLIPRKGRAQLMRILEVLARVRAQETTSLASLLSHNRPGLGWGTTIILITGVTDQALYDEIVHSQRVGLNPVLILCGRYTDIQTARHLTRLIGIPVYAIQNEDDLKVWQR
jgi:uncharacterized protein (DUF58 family)